MPNLSEHLSSAETTAQLSARFGYAAAMTSIDNLLLLGDGETWNRQRADFAGLPEMLETCLPLAAGTGAVGVPFDDPPQAPDGPAETGLHPPVGPRVGRPQRAARPVRAGRPRRGDVGSRVRQEADAAHGPTIRFRAPEGS